MLDLRPKGWKFMSFCVEMHKICGFLGRLVFLWAKNLLGVEFCVFHSILDNKVRAFISVSIDCFYEQLAQSRGYLTCVSSMSENNTYCTQIG